MVDEIIKNHKSLIFANIIAQCMNIASPDANPQDPPQQQASLQQPSMSFLIHQQVQPPMASIIWPHMDSLT